MNYLMTGHLGVLVPEDSDGNQGQCGMQVLGHEHVWRQDEVVVLQNCFPHHTWNETPHDRVLLYFDFWHPDLSLIERKGIATFERTRRKHEDVLRREQQDSAGDDETRLPELQHLLKRLSRRRHPPEA